MSLNAEIYLFTHPSNLLLVIFLIHPIFMGILESILFIIVPCQQWIIPSGLTNSVLNLNLISLSIRLDSQKAFWGPKQYGMSAKALPKMKRWRENDGTTPLRKGEGALFGSSSCGGVWVYRGMNSENVEFEGGCKSEVKQNHRRRSQAKGASKGPFLLPSLL